MDIPHVHVFVHVPQLATAARAIPTKHEDVRHEYRRSAMQWELAIIQMNRQCTVLDSDGQTAPAAADRQRGEAERG